MCGVGVGCEWMFCGVGLCSVTRVIEKRGKKARKKRMRGKRERKIILKNYLEKMEKDSYLYYLYKFFCHGKILV